MSEGRAIHMNETDYFEYKAEPDQQKKLNCQSLLFFGRNSRLIIYHLYKNFDFFSLFIIHL